MHMPDMMDDGPQVPSRIILAVSNMLDGKSIITEQKNLTENTSITTKSQLIDGLKRGKISGSAVIEWKDAQGALRANVIDFIRLSKLKATDPNTGETIIMETKTITDNTWRVLS